MIFSKPSIFFCLGLSAFLFSSAVAAAPPAKGRLPKALGKDAKLVLTEQSILELLARPEKETWRPRVAAKTRSGTGTELFAKLAPGVVVMRTAVSHGTGFLISDDGFLLTNHHVIADGMAYDPVRKASVAKVHLGKMNDDGSISLVPQAVDAHFYAADKTRDLALLRLADPPATPLPHVSLAEQAPRPGQSCAIVGHPVAGMLWTFRSCQVAAVGKSPGDLVDLVAQRLASSGPDRQALEEGLASIPSRRIVVSSCGANKGDSGGPVVDEAGKLLAVTFAIPPPDRARFSYHIHLDEVREFLAKRPAAPTVLTPDPWELGPKVQLLDLAGEGRPQTLAAGVDRPEQILLDLDGDTDAALLARVDASLVTARKFEAEFALHSSPAGVVAFYDTDNDGAFDRIVQGSPGAGAATSVWQRGRDGAWEVRPASPGQRCVDPAHLGDEGFARKLGLIARNLANF